MGKVIARKKTTKKPTPEKSKWTVIGPWLAGVTILVIWFLVQFNSSSATKHAEVVNQSGMDIFLQLIAWLVGALSLVYLSLKKIQKIPAKAAKIDFWVLAAGFAAVAAIFILSFQPQISPNGDNAEYIINAKSLTEHGQALRLESKRNTPNTLASLTLPVMLAPIYSIWGMDIVKMKMVVTVFGIASFPLLFWLFRRKYDFWEAGILALVCFSAPYLTSAASSIMTETPYIFWSLVTLLLGLRFSWHRTFNLWWGLAALVSVALTYQTRAIGIGIFAAMLAHLFFKIQWVPIYRTKAWKSLSSNHDFRKFLFLFLPSAIGIVALQIWQASTGTSQASVFFEKDILGAFARNAQSMANMFGPMLFSADTFRWASFSNVEQLSPLNVFYVLMSIIVMVGCVRSLLQNELVGWYTVGTTLLILLGSLTNQEMVLIRYLSVLLPFFIYFFYVGLHWLLTLLGEKRKVQELPRKVMAVVFLAMTAMFFNHFLASTFTVARANVGYGPLYEDLVSCALWSRDNLPADSYVASIKPRFFYVLSEKKGMRSTTSSEVRGENHDFKKLETYLKRGVTHVVVDGMSGSTKRNVVPVVESNPDIFERIYVPTPHGSATIYKLRLDPEQ